MLKPSVRWDTGAILDELGAPAQVIRACKAIGVTPPAAATIRMWRSRKRIPGDWIATALMLVPDADPRKFIRQQPASPF